MASHLADSGPARQRFQREARAAAAITHDNVIDIYAVSETNELPYLVMPYARGPSLQKRIDDSGPLSTIEVARIGYQVASGLSAAHDQGLVHRDIKPANILLNDGIERLWITDFGVARAMDDVSMTQTGMIAGTPLYMSPEQARGESVDHRSDLFSLGSILYAVCTGRPPFRSDTAYGILRRITDTDPRPIQDVNPDIPEWLCRIISRLMAKHPSDRFETADEVAKLLADCVAHLQQPNLAHLPECLTTRSFPLQVASESARKESSSSRAQIQRLPRTGAWIMATLLTLLGFGLAAMELTQPSNIAGDWAGENWREITLSSAEEADGWYTGSFNNQAGERGVLQLEWSRLKRRYVGRWRVGNSQSGAINLRPSANNQVRGAISVDTDSMLTPNESRLHDFVWSRGSVENTGRTATSFTLQDGVETVSSPVAGVVVKMGDKVKTGSPIKRGDLIALIAPSSRASQEQLDAAVTIVQQQILLARTKLDSERQKVMAVSSMLIARENQLAIAEKSYVSAAESLEASEDADTAKLEGLKQNLNALTAESADAKRRHEIAEKVAEQGIVSQQEVDEKSVHWKAAEAKLERAKSTLEEAELRLREKQKTNSAKRQDGLMKVSQAKVKYIEAKADLTEITGQVARAEIELRQAEQKLADLQNKAARVERFEIRSPVDGQIASVISPTSSHAVKSGDVICRIKVRTATASNSELRDSASVKIKPSNTARDASPKLLSSISEDSGMTGFAESFGTASDLSRRFREAEQEIRSSDHGINTSMQALAAAETELIDLNTKLKEIQRTRPPAEAISADPTMPAKTVAKVKEQIRSIEEKVTGLKQTIHNQKATNENAKRKLEQAEDERRTIIELLEVRIEGKRQKRAFQHDLVERYRIAFEDGRLTQAELTSARQEALAVGSELKELGILLEHYKKLVR